ncbi:hypothetical protein [Mesorhizobium sp.]|uniref:hypothetical protein n=1 Tax=Mesorhizobium sp. TaxID=1871066 RepID=UPI000FEAA441|nr:hypothetical protein [Mesorhizobium sp.]RWB07775.1 MAG: hypothetical protein EOQ33_03530 [Mesorhizobium sp.]
MARSSDDSISPKLRLAIDRKIASLLTAIEQEKVPDQLTDLAVQLQNALLEKRRCKAKKQD